MTPEEKAVADEKEAEAKALQNSIEAGMKPLNDNIKSLNERLEKIEKLPVVSAPAIILRPKEYRGFKLEKSMSEHRDGMCKSATGLLRKEEHQEELAKQFIDIGMQALAMKKGQGSFDAEALKSLSDRQALIMKTNANNDVTNAEGGYLIEPDYQWDIIKLARNKSHALQLCRVVNMSSLTQYYPKELTLGTVTWQTEGSTKIPSEPTFDQLKLTAVKAMTLARVTNEQLADNMVDLPGLLLEQFAYALAQELDNQVFNGTGVPWSGLLSTISQAVTISGSATFANLMFTDLSQAISNLLEARLDGASWIASRTGKHYIRSLKDTYGRPVFAMPGNGVPGTVYEYPLFTSEKMSNTNGASVCMALFGNFNYAVLGRRQGLMNIDVDPYGMFDSDTTRFRMVTRWGFGIGDTNAFCKVVAGA